jgi:biotin transport system substrate-specific component
VSKEFSAQLSPTDRMEASPGTRQPAWLLGWPRSAGMVVAGSALVAVCAHLAVPLYFTPVPLSLAPFAVLLIGLFLRPGLAAATLGAYLVEGALGLPVFSPTPAMPGILHLVGPTGGYLLSYPLAAALIAWLVGGLLVRVWPAGQGTRRFAPAALSAALGSLLILTCGAVWMAILTHSGVKTVLALAVFPFLPGDALKVIAAAAIASGWSRLRRRMP